MISEDIVDLSIIVVNYNSKDYLKKCLDSIFRCPHNIKIDVFVSDNNSEDDSIDIIKNNYRHVCLIENRDNIGYSAAANKAIKQSSGRYVLILNNDTEIIDNSLDIMVEIMDEKTDIGVLGGKLLNPDGTLQQSFGYFNRGFVSEAVQKLFFNRYNKGNHIVGSFLEKIHKKFREVDWIKGACIMARREAIEAVGLMDENFFMYFEEVDLCNRIRGKGWRVCYTPDARIIHYGGMSTTSNYDKTMVEYRRSQLYFYKKHYGITYMRVLKGYLLLKVCYHYIWSLIRGLFGKDKNAGGTSEDIHGLLLSVILKYR